MVRFVVRDIYLYKFFSSEPKFLRRKRERNTTQCGREKVKETNNKSKLKTNEYIEMNNNKNIETVKLVILGPTKEIL